MIKFCATIITFLFTLTLCFGQEGQILAPEFSFDAGYYPESISLEISHPNPEALIIYTLDGSEPMVENIGGTTYQYKNQYPITANAPIGDFLDNQIDTYNYEESLQLNNKSTQPNKISEISSTYDSIPDYFPEDLIAKANVVRAKAIGSNGEESDTATATYFIGDEDEFQSSFPIISLNFSETDFYDFYDGIGVAGNDFESWRIENPNGDERWGEANYKRRGREHEVEANFEYFDLNQQIFNKKLGIRIHGGASRNYALKSLRLYARNSYSNNTLNHPFFETETETAHRRLILRNSGQDRHQTLFRDAFIQRLFNHIENEHQASQPIHLFLNGEYWGILNIRERYGKQYFEMKYNIDEEELDFLENNMNVKEGDALHYQNMIDFATENDLSVGENYSYMQTQMDMNSFIDHYVANIYSANYDWPQNNVEYWRKKVDYNPDAPYGHDGRWRWVLKDMDAGFHGIPTWRPHSNLHNTLHHAINYDGIPAWSQELFSNLLENEEFLNNFTTRFLDLLNTSLLESHIIDLIEDFKDLYQPEIHKHINRWSFMEGFSDWEYQIEILKNFASIRGDLQSTHLRDEFDYDEDKLNLMIVSSSKSQGHVQLNRTSLHPETPGVSKGIIPTPNNHYIWSGTYFKNLKVKLTAVPEVGYEFSHWSGASNSTEKSIELTLQDHTQLMAHFEPLADEEVDDIPIHFWVMDANMPNNTPLEELDATYSFEDLNATIEYTSCLTGYPFNENHENWRKASMERRNRPTAINYQPEGNNDLPFENVNMRGLQIRQPFESEGQENQLVFKVNTTDFKEIKLSFAAKDEGAVDGFEVSYFDPSTNSWSSNMIISNHTLTTNTYNLYEIDFSQVELATNNEEFQIQLNFTGSSMTQDDGNRVTFNNVAILGKPIIMSIEEQKAEQNLSIYPNPADNRFFIEGVEKGAVVKIYSPSSKLLKQEKYSTRGVLVEDLPNGIYFMSIQQNNKKSNIKLIKN